MGRNRDWAVDDNSANHIILDFLYVYLKEREILIQGRLLPYNSGTSLDTHCDIGWSYECHHHAVIL